MQTIALLDVLRPPEHYRTKAALLTSYSADVIVCLATLIALDGGSEDGPRFDRVEALRALERLRDKVRFVANGGRVFWQGGGDPKIMALFDRLLRTFAFDSRERAFHPKVTLVRQVAAERPDRYVLVVGSRNLTRSTSWDCGVSLVGAPPRQGATRVRTFDALPGFVASVAGATGEPSFANEFGALDEIQWELPEGVLGMSFDSHRGTQRTFTQTALARMPDKGAVTLISPFLNSAIVTSTAKHFAKADNVWLVSSALHLDRLARTTAGAHLSVKGGKVRALCMPFEQEDQADPDAADEAEDDHDPDARDSSWVRGLHAKVFIAEGPGESAHAIVGSVNLTDHAWTGENWEAFMVLRTNKEFVHNLRGWCGANTTVFRFDEESRPLTESDDDLDDLRNSIAPLSLRLIEFPGESPTLHGAEIGRLLADRLPSLTVARLSTPDLVVTWPPGAAQITLPPCAESLRTSLLSLCATHGGRTVSWVASIAVEPPIGESRDRQAFSQILSVDDFMRYLVSLVDGGVPPDSEPGEQVQRSRKNRPQKAQPVIGLESILTNLVNGSGDHSEVAEAIERYRSIFLGALPPEADRKRLEALIGTWGEILDGMRMK